MQIDKQIVDVRSKIAKVKENINGRYRYPKDILIILSMREAQLEDQLFYLKSPNL